MSDPEFPPSVQLPFSVRKGQLATAKFLAIRKAVSENEKYRKPDGTQLMTYVETLNDREVTKAKVLDFELAQGWLNDDRGSEPHTVSAPEAVVETKAAVPTPPVEILPQEQPEPQMTIDSQLPTSKLRRKPNFGQVSTFAPTPIAAPLSQTTVTATPQPGPGPAPFVPAPPPGATVLKAPPTQATVEHHGTLTKGEPSTTFDLKPIIERLDKLGAGIESVSSEQEVDREKFKSFVSGLSAQVNETNKALATVSNNLNILMTALHHIYVTNPGTAQIIKDNNINVATSNDFISHLQKYLPQ